MNELLNNTYLMLWIWLAIFVISLIIELSTVDFVSIWFTVGSLIALIIAIISPELILLQIIAFLLVTVVLILFTRPLVMKYFKRNVVSTNSESFIGKIATVKTEINEFKNGIVIFESTEWTAVSSETIMVDDKVRILAIEGNKFIVSKIK